MPAASRHAVRTCSSLVYEVCMHLRPRPQELAVEILLPGRWLAAQEIWDLGSRSRSRPAGDERRPGCKSCFFEPIKTLTRPLHRAGCSTKRFFKLLVGLSRQGESRTTGSTTDLGTKQSFQRLFGEWWLWRCNFRFLASHVLRYPRKGASVKMRK